MNDKYKRTATTDGGLGFRYETKMTAFVALKLYNNANEFYLANNFELGDKFDDLVFTVKDKNTNTWSTWFIQLKHKQLSGKKKAITISSLTKKNNTDFSVLSYFESFRNKLLPNFTCLKDHVIFSKGFNSSQFLIFTNALLNNDLLSRNHQTVDIGLLSTNGPNERNIIFDLNKDKDIFQHVTHPLINFFIDKFYLCSGQLGEDDMNVLIEKEIKVAMTNLTPTELKYVNGQLHEYLHKWYKSSEYLTKSHIHRILSETSLETTSGKQKSSDLLIQFVPSFLKTYMDLFESARGLIINLVSKAESSLMCINALKQLRLCDNPLSLQQLDNKEIQEYFRRQWSNRQNLIIECENDVIDFKKLNLSQFFSDLISINAKNLIIFATTSQNASTQGFISELSSMTAKVKKMVFNCTLKNLTAETKSFLANRELLFQGYQTSLAALVPNSPLMDDVFDMTVMTQLLLGRQASVGLKPVEKIDYYVTRVLMRQCTVNSDIFSAKEGANDVFVLSNITIEQVQSLFPSRDTALASDILKKPTPVRFIILEETSEVQYRSLCAIYPQIHWLKYWKQSNWQWKHSSANISLVEKFLTRVHEYITTDNVMRIEDKVVIVAAEPGMGKSTLLSHMAAETKRCRPCLWVVTVPLNDYTDRFDQPNFIENIEKNTFSLLSDAAGIDKDTSKFNARLFKYCFDNEQVIVLLDGFDEISPYYTEKGLALIRQLQKSKVARVWITTRPIMRDTLQQVISTLAFVIKPFGEKDQRHFLEKYWRKSVPQMPSDQLDQFITVVLRLMKDSLKEDLEEFTGIPLQTRMLADVFDDNLKTFANGSSLVLPEKINFADLFHQFVQKKLNILRDEKSKVLISNASARLDQQRLDENRLNELMRLALITLLPRKILSSLKPELTSSQVNELKQLVNNGNEKTGIVLSFRGDLPQFVHRTFAEYLVAKFFSEKFERNRLFLSSDLFFSPSLRFVKYLFDRLLAKGCPLHEAVLDQLDMSELLTKVDTNSVDRGGRTALHVAASLPESEHIIRLLLDKKCAFATKDRVLDWTAVQYALAIKDFGNIAPLYNISAALDGPQSMSLIPSNVISIGWETLRTCFIGNYLQLFIYLLEKEIGVVTGIDYLISKPWLIGCEKTENLTFLHLGAYYNAHAILEYLLRANTRDSKRFLINSKDSNEFTPLAYAISNQYPKSVEILLNSNADVTIRASDGRNALERAIEIPIDYSDERATQTKTSIFYLVFGECMSKRLSGKQLLENVLTNLVTDKTSWMTQVLSILSEKYPDLPNWKTAKENSLLNIACAKGNEKVVDLLLAKGADPKLVTKFGTPLFLSASHGNLNLVKLFMEYYKNVKDPEVIKALFVCVKKSHSNVFNYLVEKGADLKAKSENGDTLYHMLALSSVDSNIFQTLLRSGVDYREVNKSNVSGFDALRKIGVLENMFTVDRSSNSSSPTSSASTKQEAKQSTKTKKTNDGGQPKKKKDPKKKKKPTSTNAVSSKDTNLYFENLAEELDKGNTELYLQLKALLETREIKSEGSSNNKNSQPEKPAQIITKKRKPKKKASQKNTAQDTACSESKVDKVSNLLSSALHVSTPLGSRAVESNLSSPMKLLSPIPSLLKEKPAVTVQKSKENCTVKQQKETNPKSGTGQSSQGIPHQGSTVAKTPKSKKSKPVNPNNGNQ